MRSFNRLPSVVSMSGWHGVLMFCAGAASAASHRHVPVSRGPAIGFAALASTPVLRVPSASPPAVVEEEEFISFGACSDDSDGDGDAQLLQQRIESSPSPPLVTHSTSTSRRHKRRNSKGEGALPASAPSTSKASSGGERGKGRRARKSLLSVAASAPAHLPDPMLSKSAILGEPATDDLPSGIGRGGRGHSSGTLADIRHEVGVCVISLACCCVC